MFRLTTGLALFLSAMPALAEQVTTFTLKNGMQAVVIEDHRAPVVTHMVWYRAGAADEKRGKSGIAHFLEHLMFKGTKILAQGKKPGETASESDSPLRYALEKFIGHVDDNTKPDAGWQAGFNATVIAIKSNEAILSGSKIQFEKAWFQV